MSFDQIDSASRGGKPPEGIPIASPEDAIRIRERWRDYAGI